MIQVPLIICYAGCHVQFIAVDLSIFWSESAFNTVLEHCKGMRQHISCVGIFN